MTRKSKKTFFLLNILFICVLQSTAQNVSVQLGSNKIALNQSFTIAITVQNANITSHSAFPEIQGFQRRNTSNSTAVNFVNGQRSSTQSIIQYYTPLRKGTFQVPPFVIQINGKNVQSRGTTITVTDPVQQQQQVDPFSNLFNNNLFNRFFGNRNTAPQTPVDIDKEVFFSITSSKQEVYENEGFTLDISYYVANKNHSVVRSYDLTSQSTFGTQMSLSNQLSDILKKVKPKNCWEENLNITKVAEEIITIKGKSYKKYKIFEAIYFPFSTEDIFIPSVGLKIRNSFFGQGEFRTFKSKPLKIKVKPLPPHPLKNQVSVGNYRLRNYSVEPEQNTGSSFFYSFTIEGKGNIAAIPEPSILDTKNFVLHRYNKPPQIQKNSTGIYGAKFFEYDVEPQTPGNYNLSDVFQWIYFDIAKERYDTLSTDIPIRVNGKDMKNIAIHSQNNKEWDSVIKTANNDLEKRNQGGVIWSHYGIILIVLVQLLITFSSERLRERVSTFFNTKK